jgi:hypothetical protein
MKRAGVLISILITSAITLTGCAAENEFYAPIDLPESSVSIVDDNELILEEPAETLPSTAPSDSNKEVDPAVGATVQDYVEATTMTLESEALFFSTEPAIVDAAVLKEKCGNANASKDSNILGCFTTNPARIYLYDIKDPRMVKAENVIAAHELLHAVWYLELTNSERNRLTRELEAFFNNLPDNHFLRDRLKVYADSPETIPTELHSTLGTESPTLTPSLEAHYAKYFTNRAAIVADSEATFGYMRDLSKQSKEGSQQIDIQRDEVESERTRLTSLNNTLTKDIDDFNRKARAGQLSQSEYEREKLALDERKASLDSAYERFNAQVANFNELVSKNNEIAELVNSLNAAIATR